MSDKNKDLLGQKGSGSDKPDKADEKIRTNQTRDSLREAIERRGGKPKS